MSVNVTSPFQFFTDSNGNALESGYVYIGIVGLNPQVNPVQAYWDDALTIPAAQPIRTKAGYPQRNGSASSVYVAGEYSITVLNKHRSLVFSRLSNSESLDDPTGQAVHRVDTIADLRAFPVPSTIGYLIQVGGYYSVGDGGGGPIRVFMDSGTPGTYVDDGGSVIVPNGGDGSKAYLFVARPASTDILCFGAKGDDLSADTSAFASACAYSGKIVIPKGLELLINKTTITANYLYLTLRQDAKIKLTNADLTGNGLAFTGTGVFIKGGEITVEGAGYFAGFLVLMQGTEHQVRGTKIGYQTKAVHVGAIPYNTGCLGFKTPYGVIDGCELYNAEGMGLIVYREHVTVSNNVIRDSITGFMVEYGGSSGYGDFCIIENNRIIDNDAGGSASGADGLLINNPTRGHVITGNVISGSGEHGTYIQSQDNVITGNVVHSNTLSGLKCGGAFNSTISDNVCYNNGDNVNDNGDIYIQSPFGNSVVSGNKCSNTNGRYGIRCVWLVDKAVVGEEKNMVFSGNQVSGSYSSADILVSGESMFSIIGNNCTGKITLSQSTASHPTMTECSVSSNVADEIEIDKVSAGLVSDNTIRKIVVTTSASNTVIDGNKISGQDEPICVLSDMAEFSRNTITYTVTDLTTALFSADATPANNNWKRIIGNKFTLSGARIIFFGTSGASGSGFQVDGNEIVTNGGGTFPFYLWGTNSCFVGNRSRETTSIAWVRGTNCLVVGNLAAITVEFPGSNTVANNLTPV
jgi:hypothetical protein